MQSAPSRPQQHPPTPSSTATKTVAGGSQTRQSKTEEMTQRAINSIGNKECENALSQMVSSDDREALDSLKTIHKILSNIVLSSPGDTKVRRLRLQNAKIQKYILDVSGAMELLLGCGFEVVFESQEQGEGEPQEEGILVLPEDVGTLKSMDTIKKVLDAISVMLGIPNVAVVDKSEKRKEATLSEEEQVPQVKNRNTILELPTHVDTNVPEWFFEQSSAEIKQLYVQNRNKVEQSKILMTRAMREKLARRNAQDTSSTSTVRIRVRAPEGTKIVGDFHRKEPIQALFAWVSDCLVDPMLEFDLILPDRQKLGTSRFELKTLDNVGLSVSQTLNLAWQGESVAFMKHRPAFREEL
jgi:hypothetical protein